MEAMVLAVLISTAATITGYQPIKSQTDNSPTWTSNGDRTTKYGVAVSQDFLKSGRLHYGDILKVEGFGLRVVNDCMGETRCVEWRTENGIKTCKKRIPIVNSVDLLVFTHAEEKRIGVRKGRIWRIIDGNGKQQANKAGHRSFQKTKREGPRP